MFNKKKYHNLLHKTHEIYKTKVKARESSKYDIIKIEIDENDENIMQSVGFMKENKKETSHLLNIQKA